MQPPSDRRSRKRLATRRAISEVADRLFEERGFDNVTIDEIAAAADVGRMTVFNHFSRKEDMFFDRDEEGRETVRDALRQRQPGVSPIETLRRLAHQLVADKAPYVEFSSRSVGFIATVEASVTLKARARAIRDELTEVVAVGLSAAVDTPPDDPQVKLAAGLILATWTVAFLEAHRHFRATGDSEAATVLFLALIDRGSAGVAAAMAGTPYA